MMSPRSQLTPSAAGQVSETMLRQLRRSRTLRKVYNALKNNLSSDAALLQRRLVPEAAFSEKLRETLFGLIARHGAAGIGDYLEFGVYNGTSLSCA